MSPYSAATAMVVRMMQSQLARVLFRRRFGELYLLKQTQDEVKQLLTADSQLSQVRQTSLLSSCLMDGYSSYLQGDL